MLRLNNACDYNYSLLKHIYPKKSCHTIKEAISEAGPRRFRPILLTSLTTFFGLLPLLVEKSVQAKFLIPMAISLAFGVLFATLITLVFIPSAYLAVEKLKDRFVKKENIIAAEIN